MEWIVSGLSCVGKSYFLENKKDRLLEITNISLSEGRVGAEIFKGVDFEKVGVWGYDAHGATMSMHTSSKKISELKTVKNVIILGVPYYEYKIRVKFRGDHLVSGSYIVQLYRRWVDELNKKGIPHIFVESFGDYKILEEDNFFRMLS